jgi:hypothetical protein
VASPSAASEASPSPDASPDASGAAPEAGTPGAAAPAGTAKTGSATAGGKPAAGQPATGKGTAGKPGDKTSLGGSRGTSGAPPPLTSQAMMRRTFVASRTTSESIKGGGSKTLSGFDAKKSKDVQVKRAPEIDGRIEFSSTPQRVKPGDAYKIRVGFVNEGKKPIEIKEVVVATKINGKESRETVKPLVHEVESHQNEVLYEISGTWDKGTTTWSVTAEVLSSHLDAYRNQVVWK